MGVCKSEWNDEPRWGYVRVSGMMKPRGGYVRVSGMMIPRGGYVRVSGMSLSIVQSITYFMYLYVHVHVTQSNKVLP